MANISDPTFLFDVGTEILNSVVASLQSCNLPAPQRRFVAFGDVPPEDCCPDLVVWICGVRTEPWSGEFQQCGGRWFVEVNVRLGICHVEVDGDGNPLDAATLTTFSQNLYQYGKCITMNWPCSLPGALDDCALYRFGNSSCFNEGGCAGWRTSVTLAFD